MQPTGIPGLFHFRSICLAEKLYVESSTVDAFYRTENCRKLRIRRGTVAFISLH